MVTLITVTSKNGVPLSFILFAIFLIGAIAYGVQTAVTTHFSFAISLPTVLMVLCMGILSFIGNYAQFQATASAPNPGLAIAVVSLQSGLIAVLAFVFFKDKLNSLQLIGMLVGIIGIGMISIGSSSSKDPVSTKPETIYER